VSCVPHPLNQPRSQVTGHRAISAHASDVEPLHQTWLRTTETLRARGCSTRAATETRSTSASKLRKAHPLRADIGEEPCWREASTRRDVGLVPEEIPIKPRLRELQHLGTHATSYRYTTVLLEPAGDVRRARQRDRAHIRGQSWETDLPSADSKPLERISAA